MVYTNEPAGPAEEHHPFGIFVAAGPGIKQDERIYGASLIDTTPTILQLFGLPLGRDMDGKPLLGAFENPAEPQYIDSWESVPGNAGTHPPDVQVEQRRCRRGPATAAGAHRAEHTDPRQGRSNRR